MDLAVVTTSENMIPTWVGVTLMVLSFAALAIYIRYRVSREREKAREMPPSLLPPRRRRPRWRRRE